MAFTVFYLYWTAYMDGREQKLIAFMNISLPNTTVQLFLPPIALLLKLLSNWFTLAT